MSVSSIAALRPRLLPLTSLLLAALLIFMGTPPPAAANPTAITYTGQLLNPTSPPTPANGQYDLTFQLYNAVSGGTQVGPLAYLAAVNVTNGIYIVQLDFGPVFTGTTYWLQINYRPTGTSTFTVPTYRPLVPNSGFANFATLSAQTQGLQGVFVSPTAPTTGQVLEYTNNQWAATTLTGGGATYTAGAGLALSGNQFSIASGGVTSAMLGAGSVTASAIAVPLSLTGSSSSPIFQATNTSTGSGYGIYGSTSAPTYAGIRGDGTSGATGLNGNSDTGYGVYGTSTSGGASGYFKGGAFDGLYAETTASNGNGIVGEANSGTSAYGVEGISTTGLGGYFSGVAYGVYASASTGRGVYGTSSSGPGVYASSNGTTVNNPALYVNNGNSGGIGIFSATNSSDANLVITNAGTGDLIKAFNGGNNLYFEVKANGTTIVRQLQITGGADVAEPYTVGAINGIAPVAGMVVSIDPNNTGQMNLAHQAYDRTVAGIISGAGGIQPGLTLRQKGGVADGSLPIACTGRVWCYCDADAGGAITAGDLLTTSDTPGHAMKAGDDTRSRGAILGKAMSSLKSGKGLVLVLVTLQ